jgi:hypothetical protein
VVEVACIASFLQSMAHPASILPLSTHIKCGVCSADFTPLEAELVLRAKMSAPAPRICPNCRRQRRLGHINQFNLFRRTCSASGEVIISQYPVDATFPVYAQKYWHSEDFDPSLQAREIDFTRPFFDQFYELQCTVARPALFTTYLDNVNSSYTNYAGYNKNCYLLFQSGYGEDCYYSYFLERGRNCVDCYATHDCELAYEIIDCKNCYHVAYLRSCELCSDSYFLEDCISCSRCIGCVGLRHKELHAFNRPVSAQEFEVLRAQLQSQRGLAELSEKLRALRQGFPRRFATQVRCEDVSGEGLESCAEVYESYDCLGVQNGAHLSMCFSPSKDLLDCDGCGIGELLYESHQSGLNGYRLFCTLACIENVYDLAYCDLCQSSHDLFGCVGMRRAEFSILNKAYTEKHYRELTARLQAHMKQTSEWGEFFPLQRSLVPYNLSIAQLRYPLTKAQATAAGYAWYDKSLGIACNGEYSLPDSLAETDQTLCSKVLACASCGDGYKVIRQEYAFLRRMKLAPPRQCFRCRHKRRMQARNPQQLWDRHCSNCAKSIRSSISPQVFGPVLCADCYEQTLQ